MFSDTVVDAALGVVGDRKCVFLPSEENNVKTETDSDNERDIALT